MPDDLKDTGKQDDIRVNVHEPYEVRDWAKTLGVTPDQLRDAVEKVGPMVKDVKKQLGV